MSAALAALVDGTRLLKVVVAALVVTVGASGAFSVALLGAVRSVDLRRRGRAPAATALAVLGAAGLGVCLAAAAAGIVVMARK